jgi:hypothetical protein
MSLLLPADPGTLWTRTAESWVVSPSSYPLDLVERTILILELRGELRGRGILTEKFLTPSPCRLSVANCWTLGCWGVVLSTSPRSSCWENNFGTSWWIVRSRNLNRKYCKSKSSPGIEKGWHSKNYTKFFGGNLGFERLHPSTQHLVARILNWRPVYQKTYLRNEKLCCCS